MACLQSSCRMFPETRRVTKPVARALEGDAVAQHILGMMSVA